MTKKVIIVYVSLMVVIGVITYLASNRYSSGVDRDLPEEKLVVEKYVVLVEEDDDVYDEDSDDDDNTDDENGIYFQSNMHESAFFESKVEWPKVNLYTAKDAVYRMDSGSDLQSAWFEGKGYFRGKPDDIFMDLLDPMVMGPSNVTQSIEKKNASELDKSIRYQMHIEMTEVITIGFDISVSINYELNQRGEKSVIVYKSELMPGGSSVMKSMHEMIYIEALNDNWYRVFYQSEYSAFVVKEKETHAHFVQLFDRWKNK